MTPQGLFRGYEEAGTAGEAVAIGNPYGSVQRVASLQGISSPQMRSVRKHEDTQETEAPSPLLPVPGRQCARIRTVHAQPEKPTTAEQNKHI